MDKNNEISEEQMKKNLLVLDNENYRQDEKKIKHFMKMRLQGENSVVYTSYEDSTIRKVRNYKYIGSILQHILYWKKSFDYAKKILKNNYTTIYCLNPIVGIFLGLKNRKSRIVLGGFLFEPKKNKVYYLIRKIITKKSLKGIDKVIVYSSNEVKYYKKIFRNTDFIFVKYGIDYYEKKAYNTKLPSKYIFSGGGSNRNYKFLIDVYNACNKQTLPLVIATQRWRLKGNDLSNCIVIEDVVIENFWEVLSKSEMLVLSLNDTEISAGHMVMFQAMKLKVPIVVNDIPAVRDYVDENNVIFYGSQDEEMLSDILINYKSKLQDLKNIVDNSYEMYCNELTFFSFIKRVLEV